MTGGSGRGGTSGPESHRWRLGLVEVTSAPPFVYHRDPSPCWRMGWATRPRNPFACFACLAVSIDLGGVSAANTRFNPETSPPPFFKNCRP